MFDDQSLTVPVIQTLVYEGEATRENGSHFRLFRELKSSGETAKVGVDEEHLEELLLNDSELLSILSVAFGKKIIESDGGGLD